MKLVGGSERRISKNKNGENVPRLENIEVVLVRSNFVNNKCQGDPLVLSTFVSSKSFGQLLNISLTNHIYKETFCSKFSYIGVRFTDQNSEHPETEDRINLTLVINDRSI